MSDRLIFHIDVNSAFLSWEAVRRLNEGGEDIRLIPSAVGGDRNKRTGIILAKSIPAKKYGIRTGEPVSMALRKCPGLLLARPDFRLYHRNSQAFISICRDYAPVLEQFSIDECFLDMTGTQYVYPDPIATAHQIKDTIRDRLGFTVNVGVGSNKLLAKTASDFEKPDKVHTLFSHEIETKLWPMPVGDLFSVGKATADRLCRIGIKTVGRLAETDLRELQTMFGDKMGAHLHRYANGIDESPVCAERDDAKGYSISTTLEDDVTTSESAVRILIALADAVSTRMRAEDAKAGCIAVSIRSNDFRNRSHQMNLACPTDVTQEICDCAKQLFFELWDGRTPLRLLGISLTGIVRGEEGQLSLFRDERREKSRMVDRAVDDIRRKFSSNTIVRGAYYKSGINVGRKHKDKADEQNK